MGERVNVQLCEYLSLHVCVSVCAHAHRSVFITVYTLRLCSAWFLLLLQVHQQAGSPWQPLNHVSLLFVSLFVSLLRSCVTAHNVAPACIPFQRSWSETTNALAALFAASSAHTELQTPVTAQEAHFVSCLPKNCFNMYFWDRWCLHNKSLCQWNTKRAIGQNLGGSHSLSFSSLTLLYFLFSFLAKLFFQPAVSRFI